MGNLNLSTLKSYKTILEIYLDNEARNSDILYAGGTYYLMPKRYIDSYLGKDRITTLQESTDIFNNRICEIQDSFSVGLLDDHYRTLANLPSNIPYTRKQELDKKDILQKEFIDWWENADTFLYKFRIFRERIVFYFRKYIWRKKK